MQHSTRRMIFLLCLISLTVNSVTAAILKGIVTDKSTNEPLIGATIQIKGSEKGVTTDIDGTFSFTNLPEGTYTLIVKYLGYQSQQLESVKILGKEANIIQVEMEAESQKLSDVQVVAHVKRRTEAALIALTKNSLAVQNGVSAQQIKRTQDRDASEVIRRIPGISIIDDKFVMVRGLSQRYNNVWINGSSVPSSEADSRAFSFDIIPSSQLDNMMIVKSPVPKYPADFTGGFILINTKEVPNQNVASVSIGANYNDQTHLNTFSKIKGSATDLFGFDNGMRQFNGGINSKLNAIAGNGIDLQNNGFNNDWKVREMRPIADVNINADMSHYWEIGEKRFALMGALNYSNAFKSYKDMENSLFGAYDVANDRSNYLRHSKDDQYNHNVRLGAMLNLTLIPENSNHHYEFKNIFNQLGKSRYTYRKGISAQSDEEVNAEYFYSSRTTYNGQFTGKHLYGENKLDWGIGYAYANRNMPDRRRYLLNDSQEMGHIGLATGNDITREFTRLDEHIGSAGLNYERNIPIGNIKTTIKAGAFGEYRYREYITRNFIYNWNFYENTLPDGFRYMNLTEEILTENNYGADKLYLLEEVKWRNNYRGKNTLGAGYLSANIPIGRLNIYTGVRFEHNSMELISNAIDYKKSERSTFYNSDDFFPSLNATYHINEEHQLRLSFGKSVTRPEFREVSSSVYYDFDLASNVMGNTELKSCYVYNGDFRYEWYPEQGEQISLALFYKHFNNPIEWTYTVNGGTDLTYSYQNARSADNYGIELDFRKSLDFIGLPCLSTNFNCSFIKSFVHFEKGSLEKNRAMQGQSPYLINAGVFYNNEKQTFSAGILYNRIGKRIVGVGRSSGSSDDTATIPNSYEMPRNNIDLSTSFKLNRRWEIKCGVRDLLSEKVRFLQSTDALHKDETVTTVEETTKSYNPGRNINLSICYHL